MLIAEYKYWAEVFSYQPTFKKVFMWRLRSFLVFFYDNLILKHLFRFLDYSFLN
jgi:hypothetical protein